MVGILFFLGGGYSRRRLINVDCDGLNSRKEMLRDMEQRSTCVARCLALVTMSEYGILKSTHGSKFCSSRDY